VSESSDNPYASPAACYEPQGTWLLAEPPTWRNVSLDLCCVFLACGMFGIIQACVPEILENNPPPHWKASICMAMMLASSLTVNLVFVAFCLWNPSRKWVPHE
jgi:hypothetical protein